MKAILNSSLGVILLIFFFNRVMLPFGLEYSLLLTPFFLYYLIKSKNLIHTFIPFFILGVFSCIHYFMGVQFKEFFMSTSLLVSIVIFATSFYFFYLKTKEIEGIIKTLTLVNFGLTVLAIFSLLSGMFVSVFWYLEPFTAGYETLPRLKLFELEASHYSFVLLPLFYYYFWKLLKQWSVVTVLYLASITLSFVLSFSLGIIAVLGISLTLVCFFYSLKIIRFSPVRNKMAIALGIGAIGFLLLFFVFPENPLFFRIQNLFQGDDTSGRGRTYEAMEIGWQVAQQNNKWTGIGLGQFKIIGRETLISYYRFMDTPEVARLPNAMAETLVTFGLFGFCLKLLIQIVLFIKFKVFNNLFQLSLFIALFVYQFTGSYLSNEMEYILWIMIFIPKLDAFHASNYFSK